MSCPRRLLLAALMPALAACSAGYERPSRAGIPPGPPLREGGRTRLRVRVLRIDPLPDGLEEVDRFLGSRMALSGPHLAHTGMSPDAILGSLRRAARVGVGSHVDLVVPNGLETVVRLRPAAARRNGSPDDLVVRAGVRANGDVGLDLSLPASPLSVRGGGTRPWRGTATMSGQGTAVLSLPLPGGRHVREGAGSREAVLIEAEALLGQG